jgi:hypothetical protein
MPMLSFTDDQLHTEAVRLGLVTDDQDLPQHMRSQVVASLARARQEPTPPGPDPASRDELTVYADGPVLLNGDAFPLTVTTDPVEVTARRGGPTTVRLTVVVGACHLLPGKPSTD